MQLPTAFRVLYAGVLAAQPVRAVLLAELVAGHDLQAVLVEVARLGQLDRLAEHPLPAGTAVRHVADGAERAGGADVGGLDDSRRIVEKNADRGGGGLGRSHRRGQGLQSRARREQG
jgi:hypothetical protein